MILLDGDEDSDPTEQSDMLNKSNADNEMPERGRHGSIKRILTDQPLVKQKYVGKIICIQSNRFFTHLPS